MFSFPFLIHIEVIDDFFVYIFHSLNVSAGENRWNYVYYFQTLHGTDVAFLWLIWPVTPAVLDRPPLKKFLDILAKPALINLFRSITFSFVCDFCDLSLFVPTEHKS